MRDDPSDKPIDDVGQPQEQHVNPPATSDLDLFASRLAMFGARSVSLDREAILFAAGQASCEPVKVDRRFVSRYRVWQASTVAMTLLSVVLGSMLAWRPTASQQIVFVERETLQVEQTVTSPSERQVPTPSPQAAVDLPTEATPLREADDIQLAEAWKARRDMIAASGRSERQLATSAPTEGRSLPDELLTRSSLLGDRSQETIQRWLKEQL